MRNAFAICVHESRRQTVRTSEPAQEVVEASVLHRDHHHVLDSGLHGGRQHHRTGDLNRPVHQCRHACFGTRLILAAARIGGRDSGQTRRRQAATENDAD